MLASSGSLLEIQQGGRLMYWLRPRTYWDLICPAEMSLSNNESSFHQLQRSVFDLSARWVEGTGKKRSVVSFISVCQYGCWLYCFIWPYPTKKNGWMAGWAIDSQTHIHTHTLYFHKPYTKNVVTCWITSLNCSFSGKSFQVQNLRMLWR